MFVDLSRLEDGRLSQSFEIDRESPILRGLEAEIREHVAARIGKLARPKRIIWTADVPKTRSGKIMRRLLRDIAEGRELGDVSTLREPGVMKDLEGKFAGEEE